MLKQEIDTTTTFIAVDLVDTAHMRDLTKLKAEVGDRIPPDMKKDIERLENTVLYFPSDTYGEEWEKFGLLPACIVHEVLADEDVVPDGYEPHEGTAVCYFPLHEYARIIEHAIEKGLISEHPHAQAPYSLPNQGGKNEAA